MSELRIFYHENDGKLKISKSIDTLKKINLKDIIWIDMNDVSEKFFTTKMMGN